jgi:hypothetical protein
MRRPDHRPLRPVLLRPLRALLAVCALLTALAIPAQAQEDAQQPPAGDTPPPATQQVTITPADGRAPRVVAYSAVSDSATTSDYTLPDGSKARLTAVKLETVLAKAGMTTKSFTTLTAVGTDGKTLQISRAQMGEFYDPPVVYLDDAGALCLLLPKKEKNPAELVCATDGRLPLDAGSDPTLTASPATVEVGQEVWFTVSVPLELEGRAVELEWDFNDDKPVVTTTERELTRTFAKAGVYNVIVNYRVDGQQYGDFGFGPTAAVTVVDKSRPSKDRRGRTSGKKDRGADRGGDEETGADDDGTTGGGIGGGDGTGGAGGATTGGWTAPPTAATTPPPAPRTDRRAPRRAQPKPQQPVGETVDGYLLASADMPLPTGGAVRAADLRPTTVDVRDGFAVPTGAWVAIGLLGLIVLGWTLESRTTLPYFKP